MTAADASSPHRATKGLGLPRRQVRYRFSMTPLADVLFQLLIFFMLSSNIVPYSMLNLRSGALEGGASGTQQEEGSEITATDARATAVWTLHTDGLVAGGQRFDLDSLPSLAAALSAQGTQNVLIIVREGIKVQLITTVLETLATQGIASVQIAGGGALK